MIERRSDVVNGTESVAGAGWVLGNVQMEYQAPREPYVRHMLMGAGPGVSLQDRVRNRRNESMTDVRRYCETCQTCKRSKPNNQRPYGLLNPLTVPSNPWEVIGIDFVGP